MSLVTIALELFLAAVLLVAGSQKLLEASAWQSARTDLGPGIPAGLWRAVPFMEGFVAVGLAVGVRPWAGAAAAVLFAAFALALVRAYRSGVRADCNCFGAILPTTVGPLAILRALALAALAVFVLFIGDPSEPLHLLAVSVPLTAAALAALYTSVRPLIAS